MEQAYLLNKKELLRITKTTLKAFGREDITVTMSPRTFGEGCEMQPVHDMSYSSFCTGCLVVFITETGDKTTLMEFTNTIIAILNIARPKRD